MTKYPGVHIDQAIRFPVSMLSEHQEFYPYGFAVQSDGRVVDIGVMYNATSGHDLQMESNSILTRLRGLAETCGLDFGAVVHNVATSHPFSGISIDAIRVFVETRDGFCSHVFFPYEIQSGSVALGMPYMTKAVASIFANKS